MERTCGNHGIRQSCVESDRFDWFFIGLDFAISMETVISRVLFGFKNW